MTNYKEMNETLNALLYSGYNTTVLANAAALLNQYLENINWVGFYLIYNNKLHLGPFQGKPACTEIEFGKGVCGTCISRVETVLVENVHEFKGHIACDSASNSEICIPLYNKDNILVGLLDIDSPLLSRFKEAEKEALEESVKIIGKNLL